MSWSECVARPMTADDLRSVRDRLVARFEREFTAPHPIYLTARQIQQLEYLAAIQARCDSIAADERLHAAFCAGFTLRRRGAAAVGRMEKLWRTWCFEQAKSEVQW